MEYLSLISQMLLAIFLGGVLGWQREHIGKAAGLRTYALVTFGSALFTMLSVSAFSGDEGRVAAQIITGIGFIGAGTIIHKHNTGVEGLTTAAGLWAAAAVGMAVGAGWYLHAVLGTLFMFILLILPSKWWD